MQISGTGGYACLMSRIQANEVPGDAASLKTGGSDTATAVSDSIDTDSLRATDFTHMTRRELADWMNGKIKSGEMSLEDSTAFLGMTLKIPVGAGPGTSIVLDDQERVDFMQKAQEGVAWARAHDDKAMLERLESALTVMRQYQGEVTRVDLKA